MRGGGACSSLEDLHWADAETLAVLDYLADALRSEPVLCVCTSRPDGAADELIDRLRRRDPAAVVRLAALDVRDVDRMVAACLASRPPRRPR